MLAQYEALDFPVQRCTATIWGVSLRDSGLSATTLKSIRKSFMVVL
jgi:hypothetical protein